MTLNSKGVTKVLLFCAATVAVGISQANAQNLVENSEFDANVIPWEDTPPFNEIQWDTADHSECGSASGSAQMTHLADPPSSTNVSYCINGLAGGIHYSTGAYFRIPPGQTPTGGISMNVSFYSEPDCTGTMTNQAQVPGINTEETGVWVYGANEDQNTAASVSSALIRVALSKTTGAGPLVARFDGVWLRAEPDFLFGDDFESGSDCRWNVTP